MAETTRTKRRTRKTPAKAPTPKETPPVDNVGRPVPAGQDPAGTPADLGDNNEPAETDDGATPQLDSGEGCQEWVHQGRGLPARRCGRPADDGRCDAHPA